jgi:hypothetical protein
MGQEQPILNSIMEYLELKGFLCMRINNTPTFDPVKRVMRRPGKWFLPGVSDILGSYNGRILAIEVKEPFSLNAPSGCNYPSDDQIIFLEKINKDGGLGFVARSIEDVELHFMIDDFQNMLLNVEQFVPWDNATRFERVLLDFIKWFDCDWLKKDITNLKDVMKNLLMELLYHRDYNIEDNYRQLKAKRIKNNSTRLYYEFLLTKPNIINFLSNHAEKRKRYVKQNFHRSKFYTEAV